MCDECPRKCHAPQSAEGAAVWRLARHHLGGQWRYLPGPMGGAITTGFDMTAALNVARAVGVDARAAAELLPAIEAGAMRKGDG